MQIAFFPAGGFVAHRYSVPGLASRFSVWFNRDGFPVDAERIDARGRSYPVPESSPAGAYIFARKIAGLETESAIAAARAKGVA